MPSDAARGTAAIWVDLEGFTPLQVGQRVDQFLRRTRIDDARQAEILCCVRQEQPEPLVRKLLETRFGRVRRGVEPRDFLRLLKSDHRDAVPVGTSSGPKSEEWLTERREAA